MRSDVPLSLRLGENRIADLSADVRPVRTRTGAPPGIVHIGLGAFHRAHQAVYTEEAMAAASDDRWSILGVSPRSRDALQTLHSQDCYYTVLTRRDDESEARVIGSVVDAAHLPSESDRVLAAIAAPETRVVTLTVTENGYYVDPGTRELLVDDEIRADAGDRNPRTVVGLLVRGIQDRMAADSGPVALASCDNLPDNGTVLRSVLREFCELLPVAEGRPVREFLDNQVGFPSSVVDRIVPATTEADLADVAKTIGMMDRAAVSAEGFSQWVMTDDFPAGRPEWESAGALFTSDTQPYEQAKLRVLNGTHSALAYLGGLAGYETVAEAVRDDVLGAFASRFISDEVLPTLRAPAGVDLEEYADTVLRRFANPALRHRTAQVAADGSQKVPARLSGVIRHRMDAGTPPIHCALVVAAWLRYTVLAESDQGKAVSVRDPLAGRLRDLAGADLAGQVVPLLAATIPELAEDRAFAEIVQEQLRGLGTRGVLRHTAGQEPA